MAIAALQQGQKTEALLFFERAREFYTPRIFREIIRDPAFDEYRTDSRMREFLKESPARPPGAVS